MEKIQASTLQVQVGEEDEEDGAFSHILRDLSPLHDASSPPPGLQATLQTLSVCPSNSCTNLRLNSRSLMFPVSLCASPAALLPSAFSATPDLPSSPIPYKPLANVMVGKTLNPHNSVELLLSMPGPVFPK